MFPQSFQMKNYVPGQNDEGRFLLLQRKNLVLLSLVVSAASGDHAFSRQTNLTPKDKFMKFSWGKTLNL
jgi:hypothetical protein